MNVELDFSEMPMNQLIQLESLIQMEKSKREKSSNNSNLTDEQINMIVASNWLYLNKEDCYHNKFIFHTIIVNNIEQLKINNKRKKSYKTWKVSAKDFLINVYFALNEYISLHNIPEGDKRITRKFCELLNINNIDIINDIDVKIPQWFINGHLNGSNDLESD